MSYGLGTAASPSRGVSRCPGILFPPRIARRISSQGWCWIWTGGRHEKGYGLVKWQGKTQRIHRVVFETVYGPIPYGLVIHHICRTRACLNPDHLCLATQRENILAGTSPSARMARLVRCNHGHEFSMVWNSTEKRFQRRC